MGLSQTLESGEMNGDLPVEGALILRSARLARHSTLPATMGEAMKVMAKYGSPFCVKL